MKKIAAINDLSGYGKCSLTVAIPIISMFGIQCCPMPTAILSNHTGYKSFFFDDYTDKMPAYYDEWKKLNLSFDCIYTGFLGSEKQIDIVSDFIAEFKKDNILLVDPVMGDAGKIYSTYTAGMCTKMNNLVACADIITPNVTEACILSGTPYNDKFQIDDIAKMAEIIHSMGAKQIIITGILSGDLIINYVFDGSDSYIVTEKSVPMQYSGTGDVFSSVLCGYTVCGADIYTAAKKSAEFVYCATKYSYDTGVNDKNGIVFEPFLKDLGNYF